MQSHEQKTEHRAGTRQEMPHTNLQHPGVHGEFNNDQTPMLYLFEAQENFEPRLVIHLLMSDLLYVQNQTCAWTLGQAKGNGGSTLLLARPAGVGRDRSLSVCPVERRVAASLSILTSLPLSLTKWISDFRFTFKRELATAIKSSLSLCRLRNGKQLAVPHPAPTQAPPSTQNWIKIPYYNTKATWFGYCTLSPRVKPCWAKYCVRPCSRHSSCCSPWALHLHPKGTRARLSQQCWKRRLPSGIHLPISPFQTNLPIHWNQGTGALCSLQSGWGFCVPSPLAEVKHFPCVGQD